MTFHVRSEKAYVNMEVQVSGKGDVTTTSSWTKSDATIYEERMLLSIKDIERFSEGHPLRRMVFSSNDSGTQGSTVGADTHEGELA